VGTLYLVGLPAGAPDDIGQRALRIPCEASSVIADDAAFARQFLARHGISIPVVHLAAIDAPLSNLEMGDVALLLKGWMPGPAGPSLDLIRAAVERGFSVVPVPGPALSITALILSGLPADGFVHLGLLPASPDDRRLLFNPVVDERRTVVALALGDLVPAVLSELGSTLDERPLVVMAASEQGLQIVWQGTTAGVSGQESAQTACSELQTLYALVIGGTQRGLARWDRARLVAEIRVCLDQGIGTKEASRQLSSASGWSRRDVYELAVEVASA
jgi:16S rRNA (cytidine1402-2'-O)-methyltransferase